ncbi:MAG: DUF3667 domain-containing protein [Bacteroidota bacterium]
MNCKNCNAELHGAYCYQCGQPAKVDRISFSYLLREIPSSIFQLDHGFLFTLKVLFLRPGHSIRGFLAGQRVHFYKPIGFLLLTSTIYVLSSYLFDRNTFFYDIALGFEEGASGIKDSAVLAETSLLRWMAKYQAYVPLMILPLFSISTYLAFIRSGYNYVEHLVINFYITGQQMMIYWLFSFLFYQDNILIVTPLLIGAAYNFWCFHQLFEQKGSLIKVGLMLLSYVLFLLSVAIFALATYGLTQVFN